MALVHVLFTLQWMMESGHDYIYLDIRSEEEHEALVHPKAAVNIPAFNPVGPWEVSSISATFPPARQTN